MLCYFVPFENKSIDIRFFFISRSGLCSEKSKKQIKKVLLRNLGTNLSSQSTNKHIYVPGITDNLSKWFLPYVVEVPSTFLERKKNSVPKLVRSRRKHTLLSYLQISFFFSFHASRSVLRVFFFFFVMHTILVTACRKCKIFKVYTRVFVYETFKRKTKKKRVHSNARLAFTIRYQIFVSGYKPILFERIKNFLHYLLVRKGVRL